MRTVAKRFGVSDVALAKQRMRDGPRKVNSKNRSSLPLGQYWQPKQNSDIGVKRHPRNAVHVD
jgi:hypothetical protein